ncbi:hypothetical protein V5O48_009954 [Marasmius crinis-equi]|uniref:Uncharacterized protein n=1 Tax=Marasmius crinis-equi TaxID=585013 RepID=A0ABR3F9U4_9AGAR
MQFRVICLLFAAATAVSAAPNKLVGRGPAPSMIPGGSNPGPGPKVNPPTRGCNPATGCRSGA